MTSKLGAIRQREQAATTPIPGYAGYEADEDGHIWSVNTNWRGYGCRPLVPELVHGYQKVRVYREGRRVKVAVHRLVAIAFLGVPLNATQEVRHLNGVRTDNRPSNLKWGSSRENAEDRDRHGKTSRGEQNGQSRLRTQDVRGVKILLSDGICQKTIARWFGVDPSTISKIARRETWGHA